AGQDVLDDAPAVDRETGRVRSEAEDVLVGPPDDAVGRGRAAVHRGVLVAAAQLLPHVLLGPALVDHLAAVVAESLRVRIAAEDVLIRATHDDVRLHAPLARGVAPVVRALAEVA